MGWSRWSAAEGFSGDCWGQAGCNKRRAHNIGKGHAGGVGKGGKGKDRLYGKGKGKHAPWQGVSGMRHQVVYAYPASTDPGDGTDLFFSGVFEEDQTWCEVWWTPAVIGNWWSSSSTWRRMGFVLWSRRAGFCRNRIWGAGGIETRRTRSNHNRRHRRG